MEVRRGTWNLRRVHAARDGGSGVANDLKVCVCRMHGVEPEVGICELFHKIPCLLL